MSRLSLVAFVGLYVVVALGCASSPRLPSESGAVASAPFATCTFVYRQTPTAAEEKTALSVAQGADGDHERKATATLGDFRLLVTGGSDQPHASASVTVWVGGKAAADSEWINHTAYPLGPKNRSTTQETDEGHGFTGLHQARHPQSGSELQWRCVESGTEE